MITLNYNGTDLALPDHLLWTDEYSWSPVVSKTVYTTNGSLVVHVGKRQAGRPITLDGRDTAWIDRDVCDQLRDWAALPGATFQLVVRGVVRTVRFDTSDGPGFQADPVRKLLDSEHTNAPASVLLYRPFFKFLEI